MKEISDKLYNKLKKLGIIDADTRTHNVGASDYSKHLFQPWTAWIEYNLNAFDADILKRVLRTKEGEDRITDYEKIIHICQERIRQLTCEKESISAESSNVVSDDAPALAMVREEDKKIRKGDKFLCIKRIILPDDIIPFQTGKVYTSENDGCITDDNGLQPIFEHDWWNNFKRV